MKWDPISFVTVYEIADERLNLNVFIKPWCLKGLFGISSRNDDEGVEGFGGTQDIRELHRKTFGLSWE